MDRKQRQQWTEQDAREALAELARTGESIAEFARRRGVSGERVRYWRKRLGNGAPVFVAVPVGSDRQEVEASSPIAWTTACPWSQDGGGPLSAEGGTGDDTDTCVVPTGSSTDLARVFALSFVQGLTDTTAAAAGLTSSRNVTAICEDDFRQQTPFALPASWGASQKPTDAGAKE